MVLRFGAALTVHAVLSMSSQAAGLKTKRRKACELAKKRPRFSQYSVLLKLLSVFFLSARTSAAVADKAHRRIPLAPPLQTGRR